MWLCLCLRALWAARLTNYSCCGIFSFFFSCEVSGDEECAYQKRFCLAFSFLKYLFLVVKSNRVTEQVKRLFIFSVFSSSTAASQSSQAKLPVVYHCGSLLPFLIVWWEGEWKGQCGCLSKVNTWFIKDSGVLCVIKYLSWATLPKQTIRGLVPPYGIQEKAM